MIRSFLDEPWLSRHSRMIGRFSNGLTRFLGQKLRALRTDEVDTFGKRRHNAVGLGVGTRNSLGHQDATQNVWSG